MTPRVTPATFVVRPACVSGEPLIEFRGDHRAEGFPYVLGLLEKALPGFAATADPAVGEDVAWRCRFDGGRFELCDDWGGLFVHAQGDADRMVEAIAGVLVATGLFRRA